MSEWFEAALRAPTYYAAAAAGFVSSDRAISVICMTSFVDRF